MAESAESIREMLVQNKPISKADGYPTAVHERVVAYAVARRAQREPWRAIAESIGLNRTTVRSWMIDARSGRGEVVRVVVADEPRVESAPTPEPCRPVLVSPRGWRLEGLDVASAVAALERLG